jgi:hypothetical protein
LDGL